MVRVGSQIRCKRYRLFETFPKIGLERKFMQLASSSCSPKLEVTKRVIVVLLNVRLFWMQGL